MDVGRRLEARERELLDVALEGNAVLQTHRHADRERVHERAEGGALLVHVDEDLAEVAVLVFAGPEVDLVAADDGLLGVALAPLRQAFAQGPLAGHLLDDDLLHDLLGDDRRVLRTTRKARASFVLTNRIPSAIRFYPPILAA